MTERDDDVRYAEEFSALVDTLILQLDAGNPPTSLLQWLARCTSGPLVMSGDYELAHFISRWGLAQALRALARAFEDHARRPRAAANAALEYHLRSRDGGAPGGDPADGHPR